MISETVDRLRQLGRRLPGAFQRLAHGGGASEAVPHSREIARAAAAYREARQGALHVGNRSQQFSNVVSRLRPFHEPVHRFVTRPNGRDVRQRSGEAPRQQAAASARYRAVDNRQQGAVARARQGSGDFQVAARGRIDFHRAAFRKALRTPQTRQPALLGQFHVFHQSAASRQFRPAEIAEGVQRPDGKQVFQPPPCRFAVESGIGKRSHGGSIVVEHRGDFGRCEKALRHQQFSGVDTRERRRQRIAVCRLDGKRAGRDVEPRDAETAPRVRKRRKIIVAALVEQRILDDGAWRDDAHDLAVDNRPGAALPRGGGLLGLLADRNAEPLPDQALEICLGRMNRHPAHGNVLPSMPPSARERDVERRRGTFRILEEHLVEVAHAIEQDRIRMRALDVHVLGHHRGRFVRAGGGRFFVPEFGLRRHVVRLDHDPKITQRRANARLSIARTVSGISKLLPRSTTSRIAPRHPRSAGNRGRRLRTTRRGVEAVPQAPKTAGALPKSALSARSRTEATRSATWTGMVSSLS